MADNSTLDKKIFDALYTTLANETNIGVLSGKSVPGAGANASGRLQTCADIRKSIHLWTKRLPAIGVQPLGWSAAEDATSKRLVTFRYHIIAHLEWTTTITQNGNPPNLDDAWAALQPLMSDGNGNGIEAILNDPKNYALVPGVITSKLGRLDRVWRIGDGTPPQIQAWAMYEYEVEANVYLGQ